MAHNGKESQFLTSDFDGDNEEHNRQSGDYSRSEHSNQYDSDEDGNRKTHPESSFISQQWPQTYRYMPI